MLLYIKKYNMINSHLIFTLCSYILMSDNKINSQLRTNCLQTADIININIIHWDRIVLGVLETNDFMSNIKGRIASYRKIT